MTFLGGDCGRAESASGGNCGSSGGYEGGGAFVPVCDNGTSGSEYCGAAPAEGPDGPSPRDSKSP